MENHPDSRVKKNPTFGFNDTTWFFVVAAFILAAIPFIFPVSHSRHMYFLLGNAEKSATPILITFPLMGLLAGCFYAKVWRLVICAIPVIVSFGFCFFVEGASDVTPYWGAIFLLAGIAALLFAAASPEKLAKYPNPVLDPQARKIWIYVGLAVAAILFFNLCDVTVLRRSASPASGSHWIDMAIFSKGGEGWYLVILPIIVTVAAVCSFFKNKKVNLVMCLLMYVPPLMLAADIDKRISLSTGFYLYILCTTAMTIMTIIELNPKATSILSTSDK